MARKNLQAKFLIVQGCLSLSSSSALPTAKEMRCAKECASTSLGVITSAANPGTSRFMEKYALMASCKRKADVTPAFCAHLYIFVARWRRSSSGLSLPLGFFVPRASKPRGHDHEASLRRTCMGFLLVRFRIQIHVCVKEVALRQLKKNPDVQHSCRHAPIHGRSQMLQLLRRGLQTFPVSVSIRTYIFVHHHGIRLCFHRSHVLEDKSQPITPTFVDWLYQRRCFFLCLSSLLESFQDSFFFFLQALAKPEAETTSRNLTPLLSRVLFLNCSRDSFCAAFRLTSRRRRFFCQLVGDSACLLKASRADGSLHLL